MVVNSICLSLAHSLLSQSLSVCLFVYLCVHGVWTTSARPIGLGLVMMVNSVCFSLAHLYLVSLCLSVCQRGLDNLGKAFGLMFIMVNSLCRSLTYLLLGQSLPACPSVRLPVCLSAVSGQPRPGQAPRHDGQLALSLRHSSLTWLVSVCLFVCGCGRMAYLMSLVV